jgi:hypothetical protein
MEDMISREEIYAALMPLAWYTLQMTKKLPIDPDNLETMSLGSEDCHHAVRCPFICNSWLPSSDFIQKIMAMLSKDA